MDDTSSHLPVCIHCGTPRSADETLCPECARPWIDVSVADAAQTPVGAPVVDTEPVPLSGAHLEMDDTGEFAFDDWTLPPEPKQSRVRWLVPAVLLIAVMATWALVAMTNDDDEGSRQVAAAQTTTSLAPSTTNPPSTSTSTTTVPATTSSTTTTTIPYPDPSAWSPTGDAIPTSELGLRAAGIGPLLIGERIAEIAGKLAASLGTADEAALDTAVCPGQEWYRLSWGNLSAYFDGYEDDAVFVSYRYQDTGSGSSGKRFETLSGVTIGDTLSALVSTYSSYTVSFETIEGADFFRLSDGGELLLWGPVTGTQAESDTVLGIYSPDACSSIS